MISVSPRGLADFKVELNKKNLRKNESYENLTTINANYKK